jgi:hypothetical protein
MQGSVDWELEDYLYTGRAEHVCTELQIKSHSYTADCAQVHKRQASYEN